VVPDVNASASGFQSCLSCVLLAFFTKDGLKDLKQICGALSQLKNEMQTNKDLTDLPCDETGDEHLWNECLQSDRQLQHSVGAESKWFETSWLLIECYFYRRIYSTIRLRSRQRNIFTLRQRAVQPY